MLRVLTTLVLISLVFSAARATTLEFSAQSDKHQTAANEYKALWAADGPRIVTSLERITHARLPDERIEVVVFEGVSNSGRAGGPMYLRASYPRDVKQATLVHELAHRFVDALDLPRVCFEDVHDVLSLVLAEAWSELWGSDFVRKQAAIEASRQERYRRAWAGIPDLTEDARRSRLMALLQCNEP